MTLAIYLALYAAILSSLLAGLRLLDFRRSRTTIIVREGPSISSTGETGQTAFIVNRGDKPTTIFGMGIVNRPTISNHKWRMPFWGLRYYRKSPYWIRRCLKIEKADFGMLWKAASDDSPSHVLLRTGEVLEIKVKSAEIERHFGNRENFDEMKRNGFYIYLTHSLSDDPVLLQMPDFE